MSDFEDDCSSSFSFEEPKPKAKAAQMKKVVAKKAVKKAKDKENAEDSEVAPAKKKTKAKTVEDTYKKVQAAGLLLLPARTHTCGPLCS